MKKEETYLEKNRWMISQSKLQLFNSNKEEYKLRYLDELQILEEEKAHLKIWTALHFLCEKWKKAFAENYFLQENTMLKQDCIDELDALWFSTAWKVDELKARYLKEVIGNKIILTSPETKTILWMYAELLRQPAADMGGDYENEKRLKVAYKWLTLVATIDRMSIEKWLVRDYKTCANVKKLLSDLQWLRVDYLFQVSFYALVCKIHYWKEFEVCLDIIDKTENNCYIWIWFTKEEILEEQLRIICLLDKLIEENKKLDEKLEAFQWPTEDLRETTFDSPYYKHLESSKQTTKYYINKK